MLLRESKVSALAYDFDKTHEMILESAMKNFLAAGFQNASIRKICADAGVTNGAFYAHFKNKEELFDKLVEPILKGLYDLINTENETYNTVGSPEDILDAFDNTFKTDRILIHYIYENPNVFKLLLCSNGGTRYEDFPADLIDSEERSTKAFLEKCRSYIGIPEGISEILINKVSMFVVSTVFECFMKNMSEEETLCETNLASKFCIAGLKQILNI